MIGGAVWHSALGASLLSSRPSGNGEQLGDSEMFVLWDHWAVVRDWEMEAFGSWLEVLPEYLPRLSWSGSSTP